MYTTIKPGLGRLPWGLFWVALVLVATLFVIRQCGAPEPDGQTVELKVSAGLPAWKPGPGWVSAVPAVAVPGEPIRIPIYPPWTKAEARALFAPTRVEIVDEFCGKLYKPSQKFPVDIPEHPDRTVEFVINSRSMREDLDPRVEKPTLRVLVAGDSHTDGVCRNSESFANLTEFALRNLAEAESKQKGLSFDPSSIEVLNAGKGSHSFYNYLGVLERHLDLQPDVFVVTVYGGNDFEEALTVWHFYNNQGQRPAGAARYEAQLSAAARINPAAPSQALISVKYFALHPQQMEIALKAAGEVFGQIQALCRERGIRLIAIYLPSRPEVEPTNPDLKLGRLLRALKLDSKALESTNHMAEQLVTKLAELGIETLDLRRPFQESKKSLFWNADWHINLLGQRQVAIALIKALSARE